jgi:4-hydroxy-2-oxoglutarate aldolase
MELQRSWALAETPCKGGIASTKYPVALYSAPMAGVENALEKLNPRTPYDEAGDGVKKSVKELMGAIASIEESNLGV